MRLDSGLFLLFLFSLIGMAIGRVLAGIVRTNREEVEQKSHPRLRECPGCGMSLQGTADICPQCGLRISV